MAAAQTLLTPEYLFEVSWEICNKVGGIYTTIATKAGSLVESLGDNFITIGPDVWRGHGENPDFIEDPSLFKSWKSKALAEGLKIKIGRWNIPSKPVAILNDFSPCLMRKNDIFAELYREYGLDSIAGRWDYIEPALFGHNAGMVIKSFYDYYLSEHVRTVAQFHEWLSGAGILYLKKYAPAIATVFTTHATVVGRAIASVGHPFYGQLSGFDGDAKAAEYDVKAKHSLEKNSACNADCFTTVSELTARECAQLLGKAPDVITPNGFADAFVPRAEQFAEHRKASRERLLAAASAACNRPIANDAMLIGTGGRYEFKNKGMDVFLDALALLNTDSTIHRQIVAFFLVPAGHTGPRDVLFKRMNRLDGGAEIFFTTHYLQNEKDDPIVKKIREKRFTNSAADRVAILFVPVYLDGNDGVLNLPYYDALIGFDLTAFPSYYEPWGYTPLESLAFHIPTVTTTHAGFGIWVQSSIKDYENGVAIFQRTDDNDADVASRIADLIGRMAKSDSDDIRAARETAFRVSRSALWNNLIAQYQAAWSCALNKLSARAGVIREAARMKKEEEDIRLEFVEANMPKWGRIFIPPVVPAQFAALEKLSKNLWWTWNSDAEDLFRIIAPDVWEEVKHNPIGLLDSLPAGTFERLANDEAFMNRMNGVAAEFERYMSLPVSTDEPQIAYFCMEYGFHSSIKLYSGGLGILAGDFIKEASDERKNIVAVGLLYRYGYFKQHVTLSGEQIVEREENKFSWMPVTPVRKPDGEWRQVELALPGRTLFAKIWRMDAGRVPLYLLDTDMPENNPADRAITDQLYGGDNEHRLVQELVLGFGGIRLLDAVGVKPAIFHLNEGHAAFAGLQRIRAYIEDKHLTFVEALEVVRASTLFTTHTPVAAGHDLFSEELLRGYLSHYPRLLNFPWEGVMQLGKANIRDPHEKFSMTHLAIRTSQEVNAVSAMHERVSRKMFNPLWRGYNDDELFISHVTNGVHLATWTAPEWLAMYRRTLGDDLSLAADAETRLAAVQADSIFQMKTAAKKRLMAYLERRLNKSLEMGLERPATVFKTIENLDENSFVAGFARRFIDYKRPNLLFSDMKELAALVNDPKHPAVFIFSGKAHPNDSQGREILKKTIESLETEDLASRIIFLTDYDMEVGKLLVQGADLWLNTPVRQMEASGTSGMKAALNGTLNFSVLDGWWAEGFAPGAGWALPEKPTYSNRADQDRLDAEILYGILEGEIIPMFFDRNAQGVPERWVERMRRAAARIAPRFTATRMMREYYAKYYAKLSARLATLAADEYALAKRIADWKEDVVESWDLIDVKKVGTYDFEHHELPHGSPFETAITLDPGKLTPEDLGIELVFARKTIDGEIVITFVRELRARRLTGKDVEYSCSFIPPLAGAYQYGFRMFPKNPLLPNRQDFSLVKWL